MRSVPGTNLGYVPGSGQLDGQPLAGFADNPFAHGAGKVSFNLGTVAPGEVRFVSYVVEATANIPLGDAAIASSFSSRESVSPVRATNHRPSARRTRPADRAGRRGRPCQPAVAGGPRLRLPVMNGTVATGHTKILGFDADYADRDATIRIVEGQLSAGGAVISAEAAHNMSARLGDRVTVTLPDDSRLETIVTGIADLSRSGRCSRADRAASRRAGRRSVGIAPEVADRADHRCRMASGLP